MGKVDLGFLVLPGGSDRRRSEFGANADLAHGTVKLRIRNVHTPRNFLGPAIRQLRERAGLTQPMLVARLNVQGWDLSRGTYAKIEAQVRWIADFEIVRLAEALHLKPCDLFKAAERLPSTGKHLDGLRPG